MKTLRALIALLLTLLVCTSALAVQYNVKDLGALTPTDMNDSGMVVGNDTTGAGMWDSVTLQRTDVSSPHEYAIPEHINARGVVCGTYGDYGFVWSQGNTTDIAFSADVMHAVGVNDAGQVACSAKWFAAYPSSWSFAVRWENPWTHPRMPNSDYPTQSEAIGIDNSGRITANLGDRAVVWFGDTVQPLPIPDGWITSKARAVSDDGRIVAGEANDGSAIKQVIWRDGVMQFLNLPRLSSLWTYVLTSVNNGGLVTGYATNSQGTNGYHFMWTQSGGTTYLNTLLPQGSTWTLKAPVAVNNNNQILVEARQAYTTRALLFTPVPEPSGVLALGSGLASLAGILRRRSR